LKKPLVEFVHVTSVSLIKSFLKRRCLLASDDRTIRVKVPANVLYDFDKMTQVLKKTLGELGCPTCCSGRDIRFDGETNFVVDSKLNVKPQP
jgi:hypothetical protein